MHRPPRVLAAAILLAATASVPAGCGPDELDDGDPAGVDGGGAPGGDAGPADANLAAWSFPDVFGVANLDRDGAGSDWDQPPFAGDDDISTLVIPAQAIAALPAGHGIELSLEGQADQVKVWRDGELLLGAGVGPGPVSIELSGAGEIALDIEFGGFNRAASLVVDHVDGGGAMVERDEVALRGAPLIMNHHLQPAEHVWAVAVNGNAAFIQAYQDVLGASFTRVSGFSYGGDVWIQDEIEFATATGEQGQRLDVVIDSIRNRGLDDFPEDQVEPGVIAATWGTPGTQTTYDSFGNLEASPPVTVGGVDYPYGRIYYGRRGSTGLNFGLASFLDAQEVQAPFELDTTWLCVGHVDEFSSTVPDPSSPKGFKLLLADTGAAWDVMADLPDDASLGRFGPDHGYPTVGSLREDDALVALNQAIQSDYLDPIRARFKAELGLTDADIILVPTLFERVPNCGGRVVALIPGMVNLIVANLPDQPTRLFVPDPFFRPSGVSQASDPFIAAFSELMPEGLELHFVDNWYVYHLGLGEVHCGTNVRRTPTGDWWELAGELLGGE